ncbi:MAG: Ltp family lipoprotein [Lachnospiraceae bacterium]|nr:Ltp family lipoprotein [Lachnospiraceae bacterium]
MFCQNCGHELINNEKFCPVCGTAANRSIPVPQELEPENTDVIQTPENNLPDEGSTNAGNILNDEIPGGEVSAEEIVNENIPAAEVPVEEIPGGSVPGSKDPNRYVSGGAPQGEMKLESKKSISKKPLIIGGSVIAAAAVAGGIYLGTSKSPKVPDTPEDYFREIVEQNSEENLDSVLSNYSESVEQLQSDSVNGTSTIRVEVGDALSPFLGAVYPALSDLKSAEIGMDVTLTEESLEEMLIRANINDAQILTMKAAIDPANKLYYLQIPELSDSYLDLSSVFDEMDSETGMTYSEMSQLMQSALPDAETLNSIVSTYQGIILDHIGEVTKDSAELSAEGVTQTYTTLNTSLDSQYLYDTAVDVLTQLEKDENIKGIIENIDDTSYASFQSEISNALTSLQNNSESITSVDFTGNITLYVDQYDIAGVLIDADMNGESFRLNYANPQKDSDFGFLCSLEYEGSELISLHGSGKTQKDLLNATYHLSMDASLINADFDTTDFVTLEVKDFDLSSMKDGKLNGSFTLSTDKISYLSGYQLVTEMSASGKEEKISTSVMSGDSTWATISITGNEGTELDNILPSATDKIISLDDDAAISEYFESIDLNTFLTDATQKAGLNISADEITALISSLTGSTVGTTTTTTQDPTTGESSGTNEEALAEAKEYLAFTSFSYDGLVDMLEYLGYSTEAATYAADNCGADWNEQALLSANSFLSYSGYSYSGLIEMLEYDGFTTEQATYAADNCGADWNEQATISAKDYLEISTFTREELISQLEFEGFTTEQAEYGVSEAGL